MPDPIRVKGTNRGGEDGRRENEDNNRQQLKKIRKKEHDWCKEPAVFEAVNPMPLEPAPVSMPLDCCLIMY